jgi:hypothetical protein
LANISRIGANITLNTISYPINCGLQPKVCKHFQCELQQNSQQTRAISPWISPQPCRK